MKKYLLFLALLVSTILILNGFCWAQCPEDPNDLGFCDTLIAVSWDERECDSFPCFVHVPLLVTHDSNTIPGPNVQDSIAGFIIPLKWTNTNPSAYCSLSAEKNVFSYADTVNGIFRHFGGMHNRMLAWYEAGKYWNVYSDIGNQYFMFSLVPMQPQCQRWWEGDSVLLATFTFTVSDTMSVCVDTCFYAGMYPLWFIRTDAVVHVPQDNMPLCMTVKFFKRGDANGNGEIHIEDIVYLINYLFMDGPPPPAVKAGDANSDGVIDIGDAIYLMNYLFGGGPAPHCP
jgi:hypothetical protein